VLLALAAASAALAPACSGPELASTSQPTVARAGEEGTDRQVLTADPTSTGSEAGGHALFYYDRDGSTHLSLTLHDSELSVRLADGVDTDWLAEQGLALVGEIDRGWWAVRTDSGDAASAVVEMAAAEQVLDAHPAYLTGSGSVYVTDRILARPRDGVSAEELEALAAALELGPAEGPAGLTTVVAYTAAQPVGAANALVESGLVEWAQPDFVRAYRTR
jgi:hypothetical protein